ncbi:MAG: DMT family transporter [Pseudomonadota bacterium]|nr:DMT family transporter [Pseudomonadota bacterium]
MSQPIAMPKSSVRLWDRPLLLMTATSLIWAGHSVIGKLAVGEIPPMTLTFLRWTFALGPIWFAARHHIAADLPELRRRWFYIVCLGAFGYTAFNALFYVSAHYTGALHMSLIQACIPALVLIGAALGFGARPTWMQTAGAAATMAGVATIASEGDFAKLAKLEVNFGDLLMLFACLFYAYYALALRYRPRVSSISFLAAMASAAFVTSIPPFLWEVWRDGFVFPTAKGFAVLFYAALGPAFSSQLFFMRGVQLIGAGRAGVFVNLVPIFGAFLAVVLLGEPLATYHLIALALVIGGIALAQRGRMTESRS